MDNYTSWLFYIVVAVYEAIADISLACIVVAYVRVTDVVI